MRSRFGDFVLDTDRFELCRRGAPLRVEPQVIELLALLVEHHDRMVSREEIFEKIWHGRIVSDAALSSRIKTARQILGDDGQAQRFIRTVHKKGFRFVAPLEFGEPSVDTATAAPVSSAAATPPADVAQVRRPTIAVLPFGNLSDDSEQEYFSDGITADIITRLARYRWLSVVARNTTFGYKGRSIDVRQLGAELDASYVVEGTVQRAANRVRVSVHLVDSHTGAQLWSDRYDREISDIFELQDEITEKIVARVEPEIGYAERRRVAHIRPASLQAWDCYHLGVHHFFRFTAPDNSEAQRLLRRSQQLDPGFGEAYAWWAYAVIVGMVYWDTPPTQALLDEALAACDRALSLDAQNATFYALRARTKLARREYEGAIADNEQAIALNPSFAAAHCGLGDSLAYEGKYEQAQQCFDKAVALSPNDPQLWAFLTYGALALLFRKDFQRALEWAERASGIPNCQYWTHAHKAVALAYLGRIDEARRAAATLMRVVPRFSREFARARLFYLRRQEQVELYLDGLERCGVPDRSP